MNCEFCNTYLKSLSSLNYHKKTNQKCLEIQNINVEENCEFCNKSFTNHSIKKHLLTCKYKKNKDEEEYKLLLSEFEKQKIENETLKTENQNFKIEIEDLKITILSLQNKISLPKTPYKLIYNKLFDNLDLIKEIINEKLNKNYIIDGQKGIAQFVFDNLLKNEHGGVNYICCDTSRHIFKYQNSDGNIEKDIKATKLTTLLIDAGLCIKAYNIGFSLWSEENQKVDVDKFLSISPYVDQISKIQIDNTIFRNELVCLTTL